ncbi:AMP-binding protein [Aeromicrobium sp. UC242_57]|uniref:AMP-binding protein n=1 Tax=Aeromicrobium sp. UC242_57 TaxID=3374624 RepID=UPI0037A48F63
MFTSGSTGQPKAVRHSHGHLLRRGRQLQTEIGLSRDACVYLPMPMFHANTVVGLLMPAVMAGAVIATRPSFSVSGFLDDVSRFGATHATYIGKTLQFILAQTAGQVGPRTRLETMIGNGASDREINAFAERFGCRVIDVYGSTEGAISLRRSEATPSGSLGVAATGDVRILDPETGKECPRACIGADGRVANLAEAVGEIVRVDGVGNFEGYWSNDAAQAERVRDGRYWSGDLAWRDGEGYFYFAGRSGGMVRVDGENLSAHRVQEVLEEHPDIAENVVYGVPDPGSDDALMVAIRLVEGGEVDPSGLFSFWDGLDRLSRKEIPRFVRFVDEIPRTATNKLLTAQLQTAKWHGADPIWWRSSARDGFRRLEQQDVVMLDKELASAGLPER